MTKNQNPSPSSRKRIHFRCLTPPSDDVGSPHFLAALQVIAHVLTPLRKALLHFHFLCQGKSLEKIEWQTLQAFGQVLQALISEAPSTKTSVDDRSVDDDDDDDDDEESNSIPVDPTPLFKILNPCLKKFNKSATPKDATQALQILLETMQICCRTIPVTSHLWSALLDSVGLGLLAKQSIVGKCALEDDGEILQRSKKEAVILWCPLVLPLHEESLEQALKDHCSKQPYAYDFDTQPYDFEVRIPLWTKSASSSSSSSSAAAVSTDTSTWTTSKSLQFTSLTCYLFLAIERSNSDGSLNATELNIPKRLDVSKLCASNTVRGSKEYELVGGILVDDEEDYVAILKNGAVDDPKDEDSWKLMETEEVIPMTESDVFDFLRGEEGGPCGTVLVYKRCDDTCHKEMNQLLSDIIISHLSGTLDAKTEIYYEEEVIDDECEG
jgi:hypothetical protein